MYDASVRSWPTDLHIALDALPSSITLPPAADIRREGDVDASMRCTLDNDVVVSPRLYLLRDRPEPQPKGPPCPMTSRLRDYLLIRNADDRSAMSKLMISSHPLALERLRHATGVRNGRKKLKVPREERFCRFCQSSVESPEHALLTCTGKPALVTLRDEFFAKVHASCPDIARPVDEVDALLCLKDLISRREFAALLAAFVRRAFMAFEEVPLVWPETYIERVQKDVEDEEEVDEDGDDVNVDVV